MVEPKRILHLTLKKEWFDLIKSEVKKEEYREIKPHWTTRFTDNKSCLPKEFDEIHFKNGYGKNKPLIIIEWKGLRGLPFIKQPKYVQELFNGKDVYEIKLGRILEVRNERNYKKTI